MFNLRMIRFSDISSIKQVFGSIYSSIIHPYKIKKIIKTNNNKLIQYKIDK
jgi:hypothetical protein